MCADKSAAFLQRFLTRVDFDERALAEKRAKTRREVQVLVALFALERNFER